MLGEVLLVVFLLMLFVSFVSTQSQSANSGKIEEAFQCLDNGIANAPSLTLEEAVFATLADVPSNKTNDTINDKKIGSNFCYGDSGSCDVKATAQVVLAKEHKGEDVSDIIDWLKNQSGAIQGLTWFLQISIDNNLAGECLVKYGGSEKTISVGEDLKISGNPGSCLSLANSDYWLKIADSCVDEEFEVNCNQSFKTNLLYRKEGGGTIFVSSTTHAGSQNSWVKEEITAQCFRQGGSCDYEASLWATSALYTVGEDTDDFSPYLRALSEGNNRKYFPSTFLFNILEETSSSDEEYAEIIGEQDLGGLWDIAGSPYSEFYDSALAILALGSGRGGADAPELVSSAVPRLFDGQSPSGCFGSLRDTAFILYASGWERTAEAGDGGTGGGFVCNDGNLEKDKGEICEVSNLDGQNCNSINSSYVSGNLTCNPGCLSFNASQCVDANGQGGDPGEILPINRCAGGSWYDGNGNVIDTTNNEGYCHLETGGCCPSGYSCEFDAGNESSSICELTGSSGGGTGGGQTDCELAGNYCVPNAYECIVAGGNPLRELNCNNYQEGCCSIDIPEVRCFDRGGRICAFDEVCTGSILFTSDGSCCTDRCEPSGVSGGVGSEGDSGTVSEEEPVEEGGGGSVWVWVVVLIILIGLVVLGIVYRDKIRLGWFKMRGKAKTSKIMPGSPGTPGPITRRAAPRFGAAAQRMPPRGAPPARREVGRPSKKEKEMEDTMRKLREMSE